MHNQLNLKLNNQIQIMIVKVKVVIKEKESRVVINGIKLVKKLIYIFQFQKMIYLNNNKVQIYQINLGIKYLKSK